MHQVIVIGALLACGRAVDSADFAESLRRPAALAFSSDEKLLYVANQRTGTFSIVDTAKRLTVAEASLGKQLSDLRAVGRNRLLTLDGETHELLVLKAAGQEVSVQSRTPVSPYPVTLAVTEDGKSCVVASLWSRRLTFVALPPEDEGTPQVVGSIDMPFAPRTQLLVKEDKQLIVADSFGGQLAIVDVPKRQLLHVREFPGHNIRGMSTNADGTMLVVAHQMLNELAHTVRNDVHWGLLMSNDLRWLKLDAVLKPGTDLYDGAHMHPLGHAGSATGDPSGLIMTSQGAVLVSLGGVREIAIGREDDFSLNRVFVGRRPTAAVADSQGKFAYVANTFDDSISVVDIEGHEEVAEISLGPQPELTLADRGELLFFNANLSHSCHTDGHTNGLLNDNFSDASFGAPKRVLSLLGRQGTAPFAWTASAESLEAQIRKSITSTMQGDEPPTDEQIAALAAYVETLQPPPSIDKARGVQDAKSVARGESLFGSLRCTQCHKPPAFTTPKLYDVGLDDKLGGKRFNPPTLRGVGQRGPYFHDNRAATLEDVFLEHEHQLDRQLSAAELRDLLSFLQSL
jgi:YVTN family beta-propeller protein